MKIYVFFALILLSPLLSCEKHETLCLDENIFCHDIKEKNWVGMKETINAYLEGNKINSFAAFETYLRCKSCIKKVTRGYSYLTANGPASYKIKLKLKDETFEKEILVYHDMGEKKILEVRLKE